MPKCKCRCTPWQNGTSQTECDVTIDVMEDGVHIAPDFVAMTDGAVFSGADMFAPTVLSTGSFLAMSETDEVREFTIPYSRIAKVSGWFYVWKREGNVHSMEILEEFSGTPVAIPRKGLAALFSPKKQFQLWVFAMRVRDPTTTVEIALTTEDSPSLIECHNQILSKLATLQQA